MTSMGDVADGFSPNMLMQFKEFKRWQKRNHDLAEQEKYKRQSSKLSTVVSSGKEKQKQRATSKPSFGEQLVADESEIEDDLSDSDSDDDEGEGPAIGDFLLPHQQAIDDLLDVADKSPLIEQMGLGPYSIPKNRIEYKRQRKIAREALASKPVQFIIGSKWSDVKTKNTRQILIDKVKNALAVYNYPEHIILAIILSLTKNKRRNKNRIKNMTIKAAGGTVKRGRPPTHGFFSGKRKAKNGQSSATPAPPRERTTNSLVMVRSDQIDSPNTQLTTNKDDSNHTTIMKKQPTKANHQRPTPNMDKQPSPNRPAPIVEEVVDNHPRTSRKSPWLSKPDTATEEPTPVVKEPAPTKTRATRKKPIPETIVSDGQPVNSTQGVAPVALNIMSGVSMAPIGGIPPAVRKRIARRFTPDNTIDKEVTRPNTEYFILVNKSKVPYSFSLSYNDFKKKWDDNNTWYRFPAPGSPTNLLDDEEKYQKFLTRVKETKDIPVMWVHSDADYSSGDDAAFYEAPTEPNRAPAEPVHKPVDIPVTKDVPKVNDIPSSNKPSSTAPVASTARRGRPPGSKNKVNTKKDGTTLTGTQPQRRVTRTSVKLNAKSKEGNNEENTSSTAKSLGGENNEKPKRKYTRKAVDNKKENGTKENIEGMPNIIEWKPEAPQTKKTTKRNQKANTSTQNQDSTQTSPTSAQPQPTTQAMLASTQMDINATPPCAQPAQASYFMPTQDFSKEDGFDLEKLLGLEDVFGTPFLTQYPPGTPRKLARRPGLRASQAPSMDWETPKYNMPPTQSQMVNKIPRRPPMMSMQNDTSIDTAAIQNMPPPSALRRPAHPKIFITAKEVLQTEKMQYKHQPLSTNTHANGQINQLVRNGNERIVDMQSYNALRNPQMVSKKNEMQGGETQTLDFPFKRPAMAAERSPKRVKLGNKPLDKAEYIVPETPMGHM